MYSTAVHKNGASAHASNLLRRDAAAMPVEKIMQNKPPKVPIAQTNAPEIHGEILPYCRITVSTHGSTTG